MIITHSYLSVEQIVHRDPVTGISCSLYDENWTEQVLDSLTTLNPDLVPLTRAALDYLASGSEEKFIPQLQGILLVMQGLDVLYIENSDPDPAKYVLQVRLNNQLPSALVSVSLLAALGMVCRSPSVREGLLAVTAVGLFGLALGAALA